MITMRCLVLAWAMAICLPVAADHLVIRNVTVVDVLQGRLVRGQDVVVSGDRIAEIGPSGELHIPGGARLVDGRGKFLSPGLWDMHTHLFGGATPGCPHVTFPLLIAHGVLGVRDTSADLDMLFAWRSEVEDGRLPGPRIIGTGLLVDGLPSVFPPISAVATTADDGRQIVRSLARRGADFVKTYEMLSRDAFLAVVDEARKRGLPVVAHVPLTILAGEASDAGVRSFEHLRNLELACARDAEALLLERKKLIEAEPGGRGRELRNRIHSGQRERAMANLDAERCSALIETLARNRTWQTPTLFMNSREATLAATVERVEPSLKWVPPSQQTAWRAWSSRISALPPEEVAAFRRHAEWQRDLVKEMQGHGVPLLAGTDVSVPWMVPGAGLHEELAALVAAGLTPLAALRTATLNASGYFERSDLGAVTAGRAADLLLLDADPLADIANARRLHGVVARGRYLDRAALDQMLAAAERAAHDPEHEQIHAPPAVPFRCRASPRDRPASPR